MSTEADARIVVDRLLRESNWAIEDKSQVSTEEIASDGFADYVLKDSRSRPLAIIETKRFSKDPYGAKSQAKNYAEGLGIPFIILSNGEQHYFWDLKAGDARPILGMPTRLDLERRANLQIHQIGSLQESLANIPIPDSVTFEGDKILVRPYQKDCMARVDASLISGRRRMLLEMATGTGKTLTIAMILKRWFEAAACSRVLFLTDRIELAKQAKDAFDDYLNQFTTNILYGGKKSLEGQIVIGTLDTIASQLGPEGFGHAYFDVVITDECHRSIYNTHRATLGHFDAIHIGLTATPNAGELQWINEDEKQLVKNTYLFYDCWDMVKKQGKPTFSYSLQDGIKEGFLASYEIYQAESKLTFEGAIWNENEIEFSDWGRVAESEDRLTLIIQEFFEVEESRQQDHPRKTIVFSVGEKQAIILERLFNKLLPDDVCIRIANQIGKSPSEVRSNFAQKITSYSNNNNPKPLIDAFKYDPLPIIAVSVDMLDTGFNHKEVENLIMLRPTNSAIKYSQMRGRGTRLCPKIGKKTFLIYDFVDNTSNFNDPGVNYTAPKVKGKPKSFPGTGPDDGPDVGVGTGTTKPVVRKGFLYIDSGSLEDEIRSRTTIRVGPAGLVMDRTDYRNSWNQTINELSSSSSAIKRIIANEPIEDEEWQLLRSKLASPDMYFNENTLKEAFEQPQGSLSDFIKAALGMFTFPSREERVTKAFSVWLAEHSNSVNHDQARLLQLLQNVIISSIRDREKLQIESSLFQKPPFTLVGGLTRVQTMFGGKEELDTILEELNSLIEAA